MIIGAIVFLILVFLVAPKASEQICKRQGNNQRISNYIVIVLFGMFVTTMALLIVTDLVIPSDECVYSLDRQDEVISINYNESSPATSFLYDGYNYRYVTEKDKGYPKFDSAEPSLTSVNYTDGPARIDTYKVVGFKHASTLIYGIPMTCNKHYEIYAPEDTIQDITKSVKQE